MKSMKLHVLACLIISFGIISGCQKNAKELNLASDNQVAGKKTNEPAGPCNPNAYNITLESVTFVSGTWEWIWSVQNPNPGNGNNGTVQDLSHWGMSFGSCVDPAHIVSAAYSSNGTNWHSFSPDVKVDPSQGCMTSPVLKFDFGTSGAAKSYYKMVTNTFYQTGQSNGYYKSGSRTGCCTFSFSGLACNNPI